MKKKKVVFYESEDAYARFLIRLRFDKIRQGEFYKFLLRKYIDNDPNMLCLVEEYKTANKATGKKRLQTVRRGHQEGRSLLDDLGITESEKSKIFDIIEEEI
tara:strand:+ start:201 stop:506 length:306 start_codon:yes stop_codon:yes gene_type:complete